MALKHRIDKLDGVPEALRSLYKPDGSGFVLDLEGADDLNKIGEFRENNIRLMKEREALQTSLKQFEGIDPEAVKSLKEQAEKAKAEEEKELIRKGKWDELVARRTAAARQDLDAQLKATQGTLAEKDKTIQALTGRLSTLLVDTDVTRAIEKVGLKPRQGALDDIMRRTREVWRVDEKGNLVAMDPKANQPLYSAEKAGEPISMQEFVSKRLAAEAAHLFEGASGGGASGGSKGGGAAPGVISGGDPLAFGRNLEGIAKGTIKVNLPTS